MPWELNLDYLYDEMGFQLNLNIFYHGMILP